MEPWRPSARCHAPDANNHRQVLASRTQPKEVVALVLSQMPRKHESFQYADGDCGNGADWMMLAYGRSRQDQAAMR